MLHHSHVPLKYWFDAIATATFLVNRMPSLTLNNLSPFEVLFHQPPDYSTFKVFGCQCFPWLKPYVSHKLQPRSIPCVFLGYHPTVKGNWCLGLSTGKIYLSRHVVFHEQVFPFHTSSVCSSSSSPSPLLHNFFWPPSQFSSVSNLVSSFMLSSSPPHSASSSSMSSS